MDEGLLDRSGGTPISRRQVLRAAAVGAVGLGLSACGTDPAPTFVSPSGSPVPAPDGLAPATVTFRVTRPSEGNFEPWVMAAPGTSASVAWLDEEGNTLSTSRTPTIPLEAGTRELRLVVSDPTDILMLNVGYLSEQDDGEMANDAYDWPKQYVTGITGLNTLTGLQMFMCADTEDDGQGVLTGFLDLSGMANLLQVECYNAQVSSIDLMGCSSLIRLCLEQNALSNLDINPVRLTLKDLRSAAQTTGALAFAEMNEPFPELWHYCIRDQTVTNILTLDKIPRLREYWIWNTDQTDVGAPSSREVESILAEDNRLTQAAVDALLVGLDAFNVDNNVSDRRVQIGGESSAAPSTAGLAAKGSLESKGWTIDVNA